MRRFLLASICLIAVSLVSAIPGLGASLGVVSKTFWSGLPPITTCDRNGITVSYNTTALLTITSVSVGSIADGSAVVGAGACDGRTVNVVLLGSNGSPIAGASGSRVVPGDTNSTDDTVIVSLTVPPLTLSVARAQITIT